MKIFLSILLAIVVFLLIVTVVTIFKLFGALLWPVVMVLSAIAILSFFFYIILFNRK